MADIETGLKWWVRYVAVPIIAGGGLIALVIGIVREGSSHADREPPPIMAVPDKSRLTVKVDPDTVGIKIDKLSVVAYRFKEIGGVDTIVETQDIRWILPDGTELYAEKGNRILGGSFYVNARGVHKLLDNVHLPRHIAAAAMERNWNQVQLETTFIATDANEQVSRTRAVLRIGILR